MKEKTVLEKALEVASLNFEFGVWDTNFGLEFCKKVKDGKITDATVERHYRAAHIEKARREYSLGK